MNHLILFFSLFILLFANVEAHQDAWEWQYDQNDSTLLTSAINHDSEIVTQFLYDPVTKKLKAELAGDKNTILLRRFIDYDEEGKISRIITDNGSTINSEDLTNSTKRYVTNFTYYQEAATNNQIEIIEENRLSLATNSLICLKRIISTYDQNGKLLGQQNLKNPKRTSKSAFLLNKEASFIDYMNDQWDKLVHNLFGKGFLQFAGYYQGVTTNGSFHPNQEIHEKVRISFVNGILNVSSDMEYLLDQFSRAHGETTIHFVFRSTEGWTKDLFNSAAVKMGYVSESARMISELWKRLINEMGGVGAGGRIIHYAHSIGASDTLNAKELLTPEELAMIHVVSLGSPTMIPKDSGFGSIVNYASKRDGVCLSDPIGYMNGWFEEDSNVVLVGSLWGIPLIEHTLYDTAYSELIVQLGANFVEEFGVNPKLKN